MENIFEDPSSEVTIHDFLSSSLLSLYSFQDFSACLLCGFIYFCLFIVPFFSKTNKSMLVFPSKTILKIILSIRLKTHKNKNKTYILINYFLRQIEHKYFISRKLCDSLLQGNRYLKSIQRKTESQ